MQKNGYYRYMETDQELERLSRWPTNLDLKDRPQFKSLKAFQVSHSYLLINLLNGAFSGSLCLRLWNLNWYKT